MSERRDEGRRIRRAAECAVLLLILAASSVVGTHDAQENAALVPTVQMTMTEQEIIGMTMAGISNKLQMQREKELSLLDEVIRQFSSAGKSADDALMQKQDIIRRMEHEAQAKACLENMGFEQTAVLCGTQNVTVFMPFEYSSDEKNRIAILDALSSLTGIGAESIKIILAKK